ncbi:MAG TPA: response regulator [Myxococcota bacterium]|nr:response regulator [Myxococcota bacterium]HON26218.1 response regulator [Myxococcota bacterium]HOS62518.1 response regulator [Myxococcota bacterium]HPC92600.1 response regulator [Myxococcota bacterium]HPL25624.1 response regulator [Myxococcota bacterium]
MARILIVDDDPDLVDDCRLVLESAGHTVSHAYNVKEGMAAIARETPELLVLDVMMDQPDDGIVMAQNLRRQGFGAPILMLTSISKVTGMSFGQDADLVPVDAFQEKPVSPKELLSLVEKLLTKGS